jgi:hypothetical protein
MMLPALQCSATQHRLSFHLGIHFIEMIWTTVSTDICVMYRNMKPHYFVAHIYLHRESFHWLKHNAMIVGAK